MKWEAIRHKEQDGREWTDQYAVKSSDGSCTVCKVAIAGKITFEAWHGKDRLGSFPTSDAAKEYAEKYQACEP